MAVSKKNTSIGLVLLMVVSLFSALLAAPSAAAIEQVDRKVGNSKATVVVGGDFNCPRVDWDNLSTKPGNQIPKVCEKLFDVSTEFGLTQVQLEDTMGDSNLDLLFTNNPGLVTSTTVIPGV